MIVQVAVKKIGRDEHMSRHPNSHVSRMFRDVYSVLLTCIIQN